MGFTSTATIDRPVDEVWAFMTDWDRAPQWMKGIDRMAPVGDAPIAAGTEVSFVSRGADRRSTIAAWEPPRELVLVSTQGGVTATYRYRCAPTDGGGTEATLEAECRMRGAWKLVGPLIRFMMKRVDGGQMPALARAIEGGAEPL